MKKLLSILLALCLVLALLPAMALADGEEKEPEDTGLLLDEEQTPEDAGLPDEEPEAGDLPQDTTVSSEEESETASEKESREQVIVTFDANGGGFETADGVEPTFVVSYDKGVEDYLYWQPDVAPDRMVFYGWSTEPDGSLVGETYTFDEDVTFYAVWHEGVNVTFDANGGYFLWNGEQMASASTVYEKNIDIYFYAEPDIAPEGMAFAGWSTEKNGEDIGDSYCFTEDTTLYAVWVEGVTVTYNANGGLFYDYYDGLGSSETLTRTYAKNTENYFAGSPDEAPEGKAFAGWSKTPGGEMLDEPMLFAEDMALYAVWGKAVTVTFDANGGYFDYGDEMPTYTTEDVAEGSTLYMYDRGAVGVDGKVYGGWRLGSPEGELMSDDESYIVTEDVTFYQNWVDCVTITYHRNFDAADTECEQVSTARGSQAVTEDYDYLGQPEDGRVFCGWCTTADGSGTMLSALEEFTADKDTDFYAIWTDETVQVTIKGNGGTIGNEGAEQVVIQSAKGCRLYALDNIMAYWENGVYEFYSWLTDGENGVEFWDYNTVLDSDITLYPCWSLPVKSMDEMFFVEGKVGECRYVIGKDASISGRSLKPEDMQSITLTYIVNAETEEADWETVSLDAKNYTLEAQKNGTLLLTLSKDWLNSLSSNFYTIEMDFGAMDESIKGNVYSSLLLLIVEDETGGSDIGGDEEKSIEKESAPPTGDESNIVLYAILLGASLLAGGVMLTGRKKHGK